MKRLLLTLAIASGLMVTGVEAGKRKRTNNNVEEADQNKGGNKRRKVSNNARFSNAEIEDIRLAYRLQQRLEEIALENNATVEEICLVLGIAAPKKQKRKRVIRIVPKKTESSSESSESEEEEDNNMVDEEEELSASESEEEDVIFDDKDADSLTDSEKTLMRFEHKDAGSSVKELCIGFSLAENSKNMKIVRRIVKSKKSPMSLAEALGVDEKLPTESWGTYIAKITKKGLVTIGKTPRYARTIAGSAVTFGGLVLVSAITGHSYVLETLVVSVAGATAVDAALGVYGYFTSSN